MFDAPKIKCFYDYHELIVKDNINHYLYRKLLTELRSPLYLEILDVAEQDYFNLKTK